MDMQARNTKSGMTVFLNGLPIILKYWTTTISMRWLGIAIRTLMDRDFRRTTPTLPWTVWKNTAWGRGLFCPKVVQEWDLGKTPRLNLPRFLAGLIMRSGTGIYCPLRSGMKARQNLPKGTVGGLFLGYPWLGVCLRNL